MFTPIFPGPQPTPPLPWWPISGIDPAHYIAAYQAIRAANLASSYINRANPGTYDLQLGVAPTWGANDGWILDGTQYLKTGIIAQIGWTFIIRFSSLPADADTELMGVYDLSDHALEINSVTDSNTGGGIGYVYGSPAYQGSAEPGLQEGVLAIAGISCYRNGILDCSLVNNAAPTLEIYLGAWNFHGVPAGFTTGKIQAAAMYDIVLDEGQNWDLANRIMLL
jgi:hypothetical protein